MVGVLLGYIVLGLGPIIWMGVYRSWVISKRAEEVWAAQKPTGSLRVVLGRMPGGRGTGPFWAAKPVIVVVDRGYIHLQDSSGSETIDGRTVDWSKKPRFYSPMITLRTGNQKKILFPASGPEYLSLAMPARTLFKALEESVRLSSQQHFVPHQGQAQQPSHQQVQPQASTPAPGWYPDPHRQASQRWWDGYRWTDHTA